MKYTETAPPPRLAPIVDRIWTLEGDAGGLTGDQPVLPDGRPELIVHFGDPFDRVDEAGISRQAAVVFAGQLTGPLVLRPTGRVAVLGVRFRPDGAVALIAESQAALAGLTPAVEALHARLARALAAARTRCDSLGSAIPAVVEALTPLIEPTRVDARVRYVVTSILRRRGQVGVDDLAARAGLTRRHLERRFQRLVGISPKRLARIARFQHARGVFERLHSRQRGTATAAACGYADQAHFIRDFRELAGCPPEAHLLREAELTGFFTDPPGDSGPLNREATWLD